VHQLHVDESPTTALALDEALLALQPYIRDAMSAAQIINPLLDVWSAAQSIHPSVARPVEDLLTALVSGSATTRQELLAVLDEVRIAGVQMNVLASAMT
jgi:hypothetical protein